MSIADAIAYYPIRVMKKQKGWKASKKNKKTDVFKNIGLCVMY